MVEHGGEKMNILIIQENGHHEANRNYRECFCLKRGFEHHGASVTVWGKGHDNFEQVPDFNSFDLIFAIENWDWMPNLSEVETTKFIWAIDAHCKGTKVYEQYGFDKVLHATPEFASEGCWLPNAYDDTLIKPLENSYYNRINIGFCGNKVNRGEFIKFLKRCFSGFRHDEMVIGDDMVRAINSYKIHWNMNIANDINYRNFETMGCATCLLTSHHERYKHLGFIDGENYLSWKTPIEIQNVADYAIRNDAWREKIAAAGYDLVKNMHTYKHRAKQIMEMV